MERRGKQTVIFAGGGTSGHINPAIAIAQTLQEVKPSVRILFCGTERGLEHDVVPRAGFDFHPIAASQFPRRINRALIQAVNDYETGKKEALKLIQTYQADAVVGTGGYVCGPLLAAAKKCRVPRLIHEQNAFPGRSNRLMSRGAEVVCISYPGTEKFFPRAQKVVCTGNPVRQIFQFLDRASARRQLDLPEDRRIVLALGGSLGARQINRSVVEFVRQTPEDDSLIILACGQNMCEETRAQAEAAGIRADRLRIEPYLYDVHLYMAAADLLIGRAGAMTCAEIAALGRAAILVPYPYAAADHQTWNARAFSDHQAAILCPDAELTADWLKAHVPALLADPAGLAAMADKVHALGKPHAVKDIVNELCQLLD